MLVPASQMRQMTTANNGFCGVAAGPLAPSSAFFLGQQHPSITMDQGGHQQFHQQEMGEASMSESEVARFIEDGFDSNDYVIDNPDGGSSDELTELDDDQGQSANRRRYHRHTPDQIQAMENFFKQCPHPDDKQRKELSRQLGLAPLQVKFWFQNKRTQKKAQYERHENVQLRLENEKLRSDQVKLIQALKDASCRSCGGPTTVSQMTLEQQHLIIENARIRNEIDKMSEEFARYIERPTVAYSNGVVDMFRTFTGPTEDEHSSIIELGVGAMEEFLLVAQLEAPIWLPNADGRSTVFNEEKYLAAFPKATDHLFQGFKREASRETALITMDQLCLVEMLMNVGQWSTIFSPIISRAVTVEMISSGVAGAYDGAFQVMIAEFHLPGPHVPTRQTSFVRYCKQHEGLWAIVDVSLESLRPSQELKCRRRPSGCLIQGVAEGYSKVTWFEHVEVDDSLVPNPYRLLVNSGLAFGAQRWLGTLDRQCERLSRAVTTVPLTELAAMGIGSNETRLGLIRLAERMVIGYNQGVNSTSTQTWTSLTGIGSNEVRVMSKRNMNDPGKPTGVVLTAATSFWLPNSPQIVFDSLSNNANRHRWDVLSNCTGQAEEVVHIRTGREAENYISLYRVHSTDPNRQSMVVIQETCCNALGSYIVFAPVQIGDMNRVLAGGSQENVPILPSGIAILPDGTNGGGSLLTVGFQILVDPMPNANLALSSVATVCGLATSTEARIKACLMPGNNAQTYANNGYFAFPNSGDNGAMI